MKNIWIHKNPLTLPFSLNTYNSNRSQISIFEKGQGVVRENINVVRAEIFERKCVLVGHASKLYYNRILEGYFKKTMVWLFLKKN